MTPAFDRFLARSHASLDALSPRERALVLVAAGLVIVFVFSTFVWRPLDHWRQKSISDLALANTVLSRVDAASARPALSVISAEASDPTRSAAASGLSLQSLEPEGDGVRVRVDAAPYPKVIAWIAKLDSQNPSRLVTVKLEKMGEPGMVSADLLLTGSEP